MENIKYTIYSYGGGEILGVVFNAIAAIFRHDGFEQIVYIACMLFGFWVLLMSIVKNQALLPIKWMFWFFMITTVMLYPSTSIMIYDPITKYERKVDHVPLILGVFAATISGIGYGLTELIETFFILPDYQRYGENGLVFASRILKNMNQYRIGDGRLKENMDRFIDQCVVLEAMMGAQYTIDDLHRSKDIWSLVRDNANPITGFSYRSLNQSSNTGTIDDRKSHSTTTVILSCKEGAAKLETDIANHMKELGGIFGRRFKSDFSGTTPDTVFESFFKEKVASSYSFMSGIASEADTILRQEMMVNAMFDVANNYAVSKARVQQRSWYLVTGEVAGTFLVAMKVVLEAITYASFIFIVLLVMLPNGIGIIARYFGLLLWLQLWSPLYAILNLVMSIIARHQSQGGDGLSMLTSVGLSQLHGDIEGAAAFLSASVPFISYAIMQGGASSFMSIAGSVTGSWQSTASSIAGEVASGNLSMSNVSYAGRSQHMESGFKFDDSLNYRSGRMEVEGQDGTQLFMTPHGNLRTLSGPGMTMSSYAEKFNVNQGTTSRYSSLISKERSVAKGHMQDYEASKSMVEDDTRSLFQSMSRNFGQGKSWGITHSSDLRESMDKTLGFIQDLQQREGYSENQAVSLALGIGGKFGIGAGFSTQASYDEALQKAASIAENQGVSSHIANAVSKRSEVQYNEHMGEERRLSNQISSHLNHMQKSRVGASLHEQTADRLQDMQSMEESLQVGYNNRTRGLCNALPRFNDE